MLVALTVVLAVFAVTHVLEFPGSVRHFISQTGGQRMLDMRASSSAEETHARLDALGGEGRALYARTLLTVDVIFPLSVTAFSVLFVRFAARRSGVSRRVRWGLVAVPFAYLLLDAAENTFVLTMLARHPERLEPLAATVGQLTRAKRAAMIASVFVPAVLLTLSAVLRWARVKRSATLQQR